eukprot:2530671-Rhodomonas_salina.2
MPAGDGTSRVVSARPGSGCDGCGTAQPGRATPMKCWQIPIVMVDDGDVGGFEPRRQWRRCCSLKPVSLWWGQAERASEHHDVAPQVGTAGLRAARHW